MTKPVKRRRADPPTEEEAAEATSRAYASSERRSPGYPLDCPWPGCDGKIWVAGGPPFCAYRPHDGREGCWDRIFTHEWRVWFLTRWPDGYGVARSLLDKLAIIVMIRVAKRLGMDRDEVAVFHNTKCIEEKTTAIRVDFGQGLKRWCPKSVIHDDSEVYKRDTDGKLIVKKWFAVKNQWITGEDD